MLLQTLQALNSTVPYLVANLFCQGYPWLEWSNQTFGKWKKRRKMAEATESMGKNTCREELEAIYSRTVIWLFRADPSPYSEGVPECRNDWRRLNPTDGNNESCILLTVFSNHLRVSDRYDSPEQLRRKTIFIIYICINHTCISIGARVIFRSLHNYSSLKLTSFATLTVLLFSTVCSRSWQLPIAFCFISLSCSYFDYQHQQW